MVKYNNELCVKNWWNEKNNGDRERYGASEKKWRKIEFCVKKISFETKCMLVGKAAKLGAKLWCSWRIVYSNCAENVFGRFCTRMLYTILLCVLRNHFRKLKLASFSTRLPSHVSFWAAFSFICVHTLSIVQRSFCTFTSNFIVFFCPLCGLYVCVVISLTLPLEHIIKYSLLSFSLFHTLVHVVRLERTKCNWKQPPMNEIERGLKVNKKNLF